MYSITFESLPGSIAELHQKVDLLLAQLNHQPMESDRLITIEELMEYLPENPARQTVYGWKCNRSIPYEKHGNRLYFRKSCIDKWLANGRKV